MWDYHAPYGCVIDILSDTIFHFTCFNTDGKCRFEFRRQILRIIDANDPSVGLINGELAIPGNLLRREVFDPVVNQVRMCAHD